MLGCCLYRRNVTIIKKDKANTLNRELKEKVNETKRMINKDKVLLLVVDDKGTHN
jgi:hypothetical protein